MKSEMEIQEAHDRLVGTLLGEAPNPFDGQPHGEEILTACGKVLCWVLDHGQDTDSFAEILQEITAAQEAAGFKLVLGNRHVN